MCNPIFIAANFDPITPSLSKAKSSAITYWNVVIRLLEFWCTWRLNMFTFKPIISNLCYESLNIWRRLISQRVFLHYRVCWKNSYIVKFWRKQFLRMRVERRQRLTVVLINRFPRECPRKYPVGVSFLFFLSNTIVLTSDFHPFVAIITRYKYFANNWSCTALETTVSTVWIDITNVNVQQEKAVHTYWGSGPHRRKYPSFWSNFQTIGPKERSEI